MKNLNRVNLVISWIISINLTAAIVQAQGPAKVIPEPVVPIYETLKDLHLATSLVEKEKPAALIVSPAEYQAEALAIQKAIQDITGVTVPVVEDDAMEIPIQTNFILLGNRSTNQAIAALYDRAYTFLDLKYPGEGGFVVRSLHNPFGNGKNVVFAGGSDHSGVKTATHSLIEILKSAGGRTGSLTVNYLATIRLGDGYIVPQNIREAEIWEASEKYASTGYFGWNMISKHMALFYMTGEERFLKEFLRLSFPDDAIIKEIDVTDGELIENKKDPLAGPYHYAAHMMIEMWDLIEESPLLTDKQRLRITNAFARQLSHRVVEGIYHATRPATSLGGRHGDWSAFSLYALGRYFNRDYPSPVWKRSVEAADLYFSTLKNTYWMAGNNDHLFWFTSYYDPLLDYLLLSGERDPEMMANLRSGLNTQQIISNGQDPDWGLSTSSLSMLNKAAYILNEGRWLYYRERVNLDTNIFRLGQSFWPGKGLRPEPPLDLAGTWNIQWMPEAMWKDRHTGFEKKESFRWGSYRSELGPGGDYLLVKGYNGAGRNPYHTFDVLELRLNGSTLLKGYHNQVLTSADGMVEPKVAMDAALLYHSVTGEVAAVVAQVPDLPFVNWRRSLALRGGRYALIVDDLEFRSDRDNLVAETTWQMPGAVWDTQYNMVKVQSGKSTQASFELHSSEVMDVQSGKVITQKWRGAGRKGDHRIFFHLLGENATGRPGALSSFQLASNAAALSLPEAAIAAVGEYKGMDGKLLLLSEKNFYGHGVREVAFDTPLLEASGPVEIDWDFSEGRMVVSNKEPVTLKLALDAPGIMLLNRKVVRGVATDGLYAFELRAGRQEFTRANLSAEVKAQLSEQLPAALKTARALRSEDLSERPVPRPAPAGILSPVMRAQIKGAPSCSVIIPSAQGDQVGIASANQVVILNAAGKEVRRLTTEGEIRVMHWWAEPKLLLVGCADEKVIAFDEKGKKKWEFTSVMDPAVFEAGKQYWFKSAYPGIHGLFSGPFDFGMSRAFIGSAGTIEILDVQGHLIDRMPVFWGNPRQFLLIDGPQGSKNLLAARWQSDRPNLAIVNSKKMEVEGFGYDGVPEGHTFVNGWMVMNRFDNFLADLDGDGSKEVISAINGAWNRISVYSEKGKPLYNAQVGPGTVDPRSNIRMMDVGDLSGDGKPEILVGFSSGVVNALDGQAQIVWSRSLPSPPVIVRLVKGSWLCTVSEDGTVLAMDANGRVIKQGKVSGRPVDIQVIHTAKGPMAVVITDKGQVNGFRPGTIGSLKTNQVSP